MAVYTIGGREVIAQLILDQEFFLAVGTGDPAWDEAPVAPSPSTTDLSAKVGVTRVRTIAYAVPDSGGDIAMADGSKFSISVSPTRYIYLEFKLDLTDAQPDTLRECGLYFGTALIGGTPSGQMYIEDADIVSYGKLMQVDRFNSIVRDGTIEQSFSFILTF